MHHQLASIHPFIDGNGRTSRLLMNLALLRTGYPIVNIKREERGKYYEALSFAYLGLYDPLVELILSGANEVFSQMKRVREETERARIFAERWGQTEAAVIQRREEREYKIWLGLMENVKLEFENVADLLDEKFREIRIKFLKYPEPDFTKFIDLREKGRTPQSWFFRIQFRKQINGIEEDFVFNFFRYRTPYSGASRQKVIPLVANRADEHGVYIRLTSPKIRVREMYIEDGVLRVQMQPLDNPEGPVVTARLDAGQVAQEFFNDVLKECFGLRLY